MSWELRLVSAPELSWGRGTLSSQSLSSADDGTPGATTLEKESVRTTAQSLADFDDEMTSAAKNLSDVYLDQRERLDIQDRVAAVAAKEGYETSILSILEKDYSPSEENNLLNSIFTRWAKGNPAEAADFAVTLPKTPRDRVISTILTRWASKDGAAAVKWMAAQDEENLTQYMGTQIFSVIAQKDPNRAVRLREEYPDVFRGNQYTSYDQLLANAWANKDPEMGIAYAMALKDQSNRQSALSQAISNWGYKDLEAAWAWAESLEPGNDRSTVFNSLFHSLGTQDAEKALEKYEALEDGPMKRRLEQTVLRKLRKK